MPADETRPNRIPWPPILYLGAALAGFGMAWVWPLPWVQPSMLADGLKALGAVLVGAAILLDVFSLMQFRTHHTTVLPHAGASALITSGPYAFSRNPIYLGNTLLVLGVGLLLGAPWLMLAAFGGAGLTEPLAIRREEQHLALKFGPAWEDYRRRTPRWLGSPVQVWRVMTRR
jgi:protein-S-isoprenylcysteine O-methyltransferase Ste14